MPLDGIFLADVRNQLENPQLQHCQMMKSLNWKNGGSRKQHVYTKRAVGFQTCIVGVYPSYKPCLYKSIQNKSITVYISIYCFFWWKSKQETNSQHASKFRGGNPTMQDNQDWLNQHEPLKHLMFYVWRVRALLSRRERSLHNICSLVSCIFWKRFYTHIHTM